MSSARSQATSYARGYDRYPQQQDVSAEGCEVATRVHRSVGKWRMHPRENKVGEGLRELKSRDDGDGHRCMLSPLVT